MAFNTQFDAWGIKRLVQKIWLGQLPVIYRHYNDPMKELAFHAFFHQFLPPVWVEGTAAIKRHQEQIVGLIKSKGYHYDFVWIKRGEQLKCVALHDELVRQIKTGDVQMPEYPEIEKERTRWQQAPRYRAEQGFSAPIEEEYIVVNIKKGGEIT